MDVRVVPPEDVATVGAAWVRAALAAAGRSDATLMPALGATALPIYAAFATARREGELDTSGLRLVQLDEYAGIAADDPRTLIGWLRRDVAGPLGIPNERIIRLGGDDPGSDPEAVVRRYDDAVAAAGGVDVAVLGLGPNGHLGFNEPPSPLDAPTRRVALSAASLESNARYWPELGCPASAITAGMATILAARRVLLVVTGDRKRAILRATVEGPVTPDLPASLLRSHPAVTLLADTDAWPDERGGALAAGGGDG
jgi:glucosamine-6-phosphate deaminase